MEGLLVLIGLAVLAVPVLLIAALVSLARLKERVAMLEGEVAGLRTARPEQPAPQGDAAFDVQLTREPVRPARPAPEPAHQPASQPATRPVPPPLPRTAYHEPPAYQQAESGTPRVKPARREPWEPDVFDKVGLAIKRWFTVGNVPVKIGILVLFAGVAALLKYAADQGWLNAPIELRLAGVAAGALAALVFAWRKREAHRVFALSLQGGAIGVLLLVVFAAFKLYGLLNAPAAFALSVVLVAGAGMLAVLQDAKALAFFAVLAGFLAPIWLSTGSGNHVALFSYYAVLNSAIFAIAWWKAWRVLNLLGFGFTFGIGIAWGVLDYDASKFASTEPFLLLFFALYLLIPLLFARRQPAGRRDFIDGCLVFGTPLIAFSLQACLLHGARMPLAFNALGLAALYAALAWTLRRRGNFSVLGTSYALLAVGFATLAVPLAFSARATGCVFALEGAALVWLGLRQQRRLPEFSGIALQLLAAIAFGIGAGGRAGDVAIANAGFMSALLIALAALATAWTYRDAGRIVSARLSYLWGLVWWCGNALDEIDRFAPADAAADVTLAFAALTGWLAAEVHRRKPDLTLVATTLATMAAAAPLAMMQSQAHAQPFAGYGAVAWVIYIALGLRSLVCLRQGDHPLAPWAQLVWWLVLPFAASLSLAWLGGRFALDEGWRIAATALPWLLVIGISLMRWPWLRAPLQERFDAMRPVLQSLYFAIAATGWLASLASAGGSAPLPWVPVLNPLELAQLATLLLAGRWMWSGHAPSTLVSVRVPVLAASTFALITSIPLHAVHHWGGLPWNAALIGTSLAQTTLTVTWSVLGVIGWVLGSRRGNRPLWLVGAVLMAVVLAKLIVVDRGNLGNGLGIASFIAYGLLCTVVGYLAPAPPRAHQEEATA